MASETSHVPVSKPPEGKSVVTPAHLSESVQSKITGKDRCFPVLHTRCSRVHLMFTKRGPVSFRNFSPHLGMVSLKIYIYLIMLQSQELHQVEEINIWKGYQIRTLQRCWVGNRGRGQGKSISLEMGLHQQHDDPDRKARA